MSTFDIERRITPSQTAIEYRCGCEKTGEKKPVIVGYAAVFNSESRNLGGFVETIHPNAFDEVLSEKPDVVGVFNHDKNVLLGRSSNDSLKLTTDAYGLRYEITPPNTQDARDVVELVRGGYVVGSSFAFAVKRDGGDAWSTDPKGMRRREIRSVGLLDDVGPVVRPAYGSSSVVVSRRAFEMALGEANRPNQTMANAAKRGLKLSDKHGSVDSSLISVAERIANREIVTMEEVGMLNEIHERCAAAKNSSWTGSPAWIEWQLAGGDSGQKWIQRRHEVATESVISIPESSTLQSDTSEEARDEDMAEPTAGSLSAANYDLYESLERIAEEDGQWPQSGPDGAHYMKRSMFADQGMICSNCVFWNSEGNCDIVEGKIEENGICRHWIIPEEKLNVEDPLASIGKDDAEAVAPRSEPAVVVADPEAPAPRSVDTAAVIAKLKALALGAAANGTSR
jgi:HK97 family phage prohead protease